MEGNTEIQKPSEGKLKPETQTLPTAAADLSSTLGASFNQALEEDRKLGEPKISVNIFYSPHGTDKDFEGLDEQFRKSDIYIPEAFGWSPAYLGLLRAISAGKVSPEVVLKGLRINKNSEYYARDKKLYELIYNSQKPIALVDLPENYPLIGRNESHRIPDINFRSDFDSTLESFRKNFKEWADVEVERKRICVIK